ncbi:MAG TPA: THUMP domain-containing protein, partial [Burkholderiales bacterium]|nr:THUMP domain-containing protein [Burkholderiales bacterium]
MSSSPSNAFFATAPRGLEPLLQKEISSLGGENPALVPGGVAFGGGWDVCHRVNLWSRIASRVLWRVHTFSYANETDVYEKAKKLDWPKFFALERTLRVNVTAQKSPLKSLEFATLRIKDAVCDRFRDATGKRPNVERTAPDVRVHAFLETDRATLYLDTSGEPLFKRGWRMDIAEAPIRENLAAGIIMLSGWKFDQPLLDPMCGGGTLLSEAAAMARGRAPGAKRAFGFEKLNGFDSKLWERIRNERTVQPVEPRLYGSDTDPDALKAARRNLGAAGVERWVKLEQADVLERAAPAEAGVMVANPPYG